MSTINEAAVLRFYVDTKEYSDRMTAIEAQAASSLATYKTEVAAAIAQVNLAQSQTITALTLEVSTLKTNLTNSITATQTNLINRADQLAQNVTDITNQLTQDKATFTQEIQDALDFLKEDASVASALRTPRKIQGVDFDGTQDISLPVFTTQIDGLVPKRVGATSTKYLREDGTWVVPTNTTYALLTASNAEAGTATDANTISAQVLKDAIKFHAPPVTDITGNAGTATKLAIARTINDVEFDGSANITLPLATTSVSGTVQLNNTLTSTSTGQALTAAQGKALNDSKLAKTENAISATKLQTSRTISLTGGVTGSVSFDGSVNASISTSITGLGVANGIATLDSAGLVPSNQLPSYVDDVLEYLNVAAFPATGETGKIYVETAGNTTYRWGGTGYVKIASGDVASVAGKTGVVTLTKTDVGLSNVDNTADSSKSVASASKLTTARTIGGVSFDGTAAINLPGVNTAGNQNTSGNAASATKLQTARTIAISGAVTGTATSFDGSANIAIATTEVDGSKISIGTIPVARIPTLNQSTTGNASTASKLGTARSVTFSGGATGSYSFDGSTNVVCELTVAPPVVSSIDASAIATGTLNAARIPTLNQSTSGNAATATKLATARKINGVAFDGTADIQIPFETANPTETPNATETIAGTAKIATTAIAQAGTNDTDFITAKKLRDALNASGNAPISACRAWVCFNGKASPPEILSSLNISSVVKNATGDYTLNFTTPLENSNYAVSCGGALGVSGVKIYPCVKAFGHGGVPALKTPTQLGIVCVASVTNASPYDISEIYIEVFC